MSKKNKSILSATIAVSILAVVGKVLGFGREAIIAAYFGATAQTDAFFFAQGMPSMIFPAVGHSLAIAFTSFYVKKRTEDKQTSDIYASRIINLAGLLGIALGLLGVLLAPLLVPLFAPGFFGEQLTLAVHLTRLTMGAFVLTMLTYVLGAILYSNKIFVRSQLAAFLYDLIVMVGTILLGKDATMEQLTLIVVLGVFMQVVGSIILARKCVDYKPFTNPINRETSILIKMALPILLGNSITQINNIVDKYLASNLAEGSISALSYARSLNAVVISVFVTSLSTVLYPTLTEDAASGDMKKYGINLVQSLKGLTFVLVPVCCITLFEAEDIVKAVFGRGSFNETAVAITASVLAFYAPRFLFVGIREVLSRGFFAIQNSKVPAINSAIGVGCNIVASVILVRYMGIGGIALGTSISALVSALLLMISVHRLIPDVKFHGFLIPFSKQVGAGVVICLVLYIVKRVNLIAAGALLRFILLTLIGGIIYLVIIYFIDREQLNIIKKLVKGKK